MRSIWVSPPLWGEAKKLASFTSKSGCGPKLRGGRRNYFLKLVGRFS